MVVEYDDDHDDAGGAVRRHGGAITAPHTYSYKFQSLLGDQRAFQDIGQRGTYRRDIYPGRFKSGR